MDGFLHALPELQLRRGIFHFIPNILPILFLLPLFVVGIPVAFAIFLFAEVNPVARFQLNDKPGIIGFFFFAILLAPNMIDYLLILFRYPPVIMPEGSATIAIPTKEETIVTIRPAVETGYMSP